MARAQLSWADLLVSLLWKHSTDSGVGTDTSVSGTASAQVSFAVLAIGTSKVGSDSGTGTDSGLRQSVGGTQKAGSDAGSGAEEGNLSVGGTQSRASADFGFGFSRYAAAGLVFLFRDADSPPSLTATDNSVQVSDLGSGIDSSSKQDQDIFAETDDAGGGFDTSTLTILFNSLIGTDAGIGTDNAQFIPGQASELPEVTLEVAFDSDPVEESQVYTVVSSDSNGKQLEFSAKRGRQDELRQPETGTMITVLFNQDRSFDPAYSLSPYSPDILPVKQARLNAIRGSTTYRLFVGDIEQWPQRSSGRLNSAGIQANDGFDALSQVEVTVTRPAELSGSRINAILDAASWPASKRNIDAGVTLLHPNTYTGTALELIRQVVADEDGYFFMSGNGDARFIERHARFKPPYTTPFLTLSNRPTGIKLPLTDADYQVDKDFIKNEVIVKVQAVVDTEGNTVEEEKQFSASDPTSQTKYRPRTLTYDNSSISDDNEAQTKVEYHVDRLKDPRVRVKSVTIEPQQDTNLWGHALGREIGDRIAVEIYPVQTGTEEVLLFEGIIEYVSHHYVIGRWVTVWYLSPADMNDYWILEDPVLGVLGSTTRVGY